MGTPLELEPGETLLFQEALPLYPDSGTFSLAFALTDRALYWAADKSGGLLPASPVRIPRSEIREVVVQRTPPAAVWRMAGLLILFGAVASYVNPIKDLEELLLFPIVLGLLMPFTMVGRRSLALALADGQRLVWRPPGFLIGARRRRLQEGLDRILDACRQAGIPVREERT